MYQNDSTVATLWLLSCYESRQKNGRMFQTRTKKEEKKGGRLITSTNWTLSDNIFLWTDTLIIKIKTAIEHLVCYHSIRNYRNIWQTILHCFTWCDVLWEVSSRFGYQANLEKLCLLKLHLYCKKNVTCNRIILYNIKLQSIKFRNNTGNTIAIHSTVNTCSINFWSYFV